MLGKEHLKLVKCNQPFIHTIAVPNGVYPEYFIYWLSTSKAQDVHVSIDVLQIWVIALALLSHQSTIDFVFGDKLQRAAEYSETWLPAFGPII